MFLYPYRCFTACLVYLILILGNVRSNTCNYKLQIEQHIYNDGFHRNLTYVIEFINENQEWSWIDKKDCIAGLEQTLPAGAYASPDEVEKYYNDYFKSAIFKSPVNVELPADSSTPLLIHLILNIIDYKIVFSIPIHGRYHAATSGGGKVKIEIPHPKLYLNCQDKRLHSCQNVDRGIGTENTFCSKDGNPEMCKWKMPNVNVVTEPLHFEVPVGNTDHFYVVASGTVVAVLFATLYLLISIHNYQVSTRKLK